MTREETANLVRRIQNGEREAFDLLFAAYQQQAVRTATLICKDQALAEDATQEAFINCLLHIQTLQNPYGFATWFYKILTRCAWKLCKSNPSTADFEQIPNIDGKEDIYPSEQKAAYEALYQAICLLGTKQRTTIILYYFNDFSIKEIAAIFSVPEATVKTRLFAAKHRLQKFLKQEHGCGKEVLQYGKI